MAAPTPLIDNVDLDHVVARASDGQARTLANLVADANALCRHLPPGGALLNVCEDRYRFAVGFVSCLLSGRVSLQPSSQSAATLQQMREAYPDVVCLCDGLYDTAGLPRVDFPSSLEGSGDAVTAMPMVDGDRVVAVLFTSGSTGLPQPHGKTWAKLKRNGLVEAQRLGLMSQSHSVVGTVPVQHSYGFESTFLMGLHGHACFGTGKPFFPQDIADSLAAMPEPRLLVTTPFHLSALVDSGVTVPPLAMVLSATAPLPADLARRAEAALVAPVHEIYGSTESSQLASRRTLDGDVWTLLEGVELSQEDDITSASGGHVEGVVPLSDVIELFPGHRFRLLGRHADMINIAGKRTSLAYLNHQLQAIEGVEDGAFFLPEVEGKDNLGVHRLVAFVRAPNLDRPALTQALHGCIDPVFMPRPLVWVSELPRNDTGKILRSTLEALYEREVLRRG
ncbi:AMP-binding protein [Hydrogenophaga sp. 5NK40-0174]|uniref:AMP-binding protein n=1 Tax=Hydrogenophaga sp. 5NK40-0174 TaxID=3127649 RepID=UPI0033402AFB